ncbi:hypothetical protein IPJ72_00835 [Candidatus Peregrinibacteria bacterium]|nr:MAG: hypothetical protein IPJ72_00835 [Candidatus Peregrinibacteria bacterium]
MPDKGQANSTDHALIEAHQSYLKRLQEAFDAKCEAIGARAKEKLATVPESEKETRKQIMEEEQAALNQVLNELRRVVSEKSSDVRQKLEQLEEQRNQNNLNLEAELAHL